MPCGSNAAETCGGAQRLSVFKDTTFAAPGVVATVGTFSSQGCWSEGNHTRALDGALVFNDKAMTPQICTTACFAKGFAFAGIEYGSECYCGHALAPTSIKRPEKECSMLCPGNNKAFCGAGDRLNVYKSSVIPPPPPSPPAAVAAPAVAPATPADTATGDDTRAVRVS
jgi:hypothetical protein